jgi:broad specificity phosphatase PhoE
MHHHFLITPPEIVAFSLVLLLIAAVCIRMETKRFYFIRHGRTLLNDAHIKQGPDGSLSEPGVRQADAVGKALAGIRNPRIQAIYSSPYTRARETAEKVNSYLHVHISYTPLLAERRNPKEVIGKKADDPEVERITGLIEKGFHENNYRFSDEENFIDLSTRAKRCLSYLQHRWQHQICVVTHHAFLQMFLSYLLYRENLTAENYAKLAFFNPADNAGVTICEYNPWKRFNATHGWTVATYNQVVEVPPA